MEYTKRAYQYQNQSYGTKCQFYTFQPEYLLPGPHFRKRQSQNFFIKMVDYLKKALIYGHTSRISS